MTAQHTDVLSEHDSTLYSDRVGDPDVFLLDVIINVCVMKHGYIL